MSYDSSTGIISAPVSIDDVRSCLGESSYDLGTLCKSSKINMYSIHKPTRWTDLFQTEAAKGSTPITEAQWWMGVDGDYNINVTKTTNGKIALGGSTIYGYFQEPASNAWGIKHPNGSTYPYRLDDFDGYCHKADWSSNSPLTDHPMNLQCDAAPKLRLDYYYGGTFELAMKTDKNIGFGEIIGYSSITSLTDWKGGMSLGFMFMVKGDDDYDYFCCTLPIEGSKEGSEQTFTDSAGIIQGTVYIVSEYQVAVSIYLPSKIFKSYIGKTVNIRPVFSSYPCHWTKADDIDSNIPVWLIIPPSSNANTKYAITGTLRETTIEDLNYKAPICTLHDLVVSYSNGKYNLSSVYFKAVRRTPDGYYSSWTSIIITSIDLVCTCQVSEEPGVWIYATHSSTGVSNSSGIKTYNFGTTSFATRIDKLINDQVASVTPSFPTTGNITKKCVSITIGYKIQVTDNSKTYWDYGNASTKVEI